MDLEKFLSERLTKEQMEGLDVNSKTERMGKGKEDNNQRLIITLPNEIVDMISSNTECKNILRNNIVRFMRSLKSDLELESYIVSIDTISYI